MRDRAYCPCHNYPSNGPVREQRQRRAGSLGGVVGVGAAENKVLYANRPPNLQFSFDDAFGWVKSTADEIANLAQQLCAEEGPIRRKQVDLIKKGNLAKQRLEGLKAISNPSSAERVLIQDYTVIYGESKRITDFIYSVFAFGAWVGIDSCEALMASNPERVQSKRSTPLPPEQPPLTSASNGVGILPAVIAATCAAVTAATAGLGAVPCMLVSIGIIAITVYGIYEIFNRLLDLFDGAEKTYRKTLDEQYKVMREICDKALQDPSYLPACEKAQAALKKLNDNRPKTLLEQLTPVLIAGAVVMGGVALARSAMRNAAKRKAAKLLTAE